MDIRFLNRPIRWIEGNTVLSAVFLLTIVPFGGTASAAPGGESSTAAESAGGSLPLMIAAIAGAALVVTLVVVGVVVVARGKRKRAGLESNVMPRPPYTGGQAQWSGVPGQSAPPPGTTPDNQAGGPPAPPRNVQPPQ